MVPVPRQNLSLLHKQTEACSNDFASSSDNTASNDRTIGI
jgi:hypothetical protein